PTGPQTATQTTLNDRANGADGPRVSGALLQHSLVEGACLCQNKWAPSRLGGNTYYGTRTYERTVRGRMSSTMLAAREHDKLLQQYPLLATIGDTPLVRVDVLAEECPDVTVSAKLEYFNPGGSLKDRPVRQILLDALTSGELRPGKIILDSSSGN